MQDQQSPGEEQIEALREVVSLNVQKFANLGVKLHNELLIEERLDFAENGLGNFEKERALSNLCSIFLVLEIRIDSSLCEFLDLILQINLFVNQVACDEGTDGRESPELDFTQLSN